MMSRLFLSLRLRQRNKRDASVCIRLMTDMPLVENVKSLAYDYAN